VIFISLDTLRSNWLVIATDANIKQAVTFWLQTLDTSFLKHCITSRKVTGLMPDGVIGIFHCLNPSGRIVARESTQPLPKMSTRNISWGVNVAGA
jgi:hypothetical protein